MITFTYSVSFLIYSGDKIQLDIYMFRSENHWYDYIHHVLDMHLYDVLIMKRRQTDSFRILDCCTKLITLRMDIPIIK